MCEQLAVCYTWGRVQCSKATCMRTIQIQVGSKAIVPFPIQFNIYLLTVELLIIPAGHKGCSKVKVPTGEDASFL